MPLEEAFQTDLELQTSHQRTVVLDELDYLLEGARPHWPPQQRVPCLQRLHEWLGADRHADAIMRTEHRAPLVLQAAAAFDPQNPALARPCLLLLLHVVGDPRNHGLVGEEVWGAFLQVLATSPACGLPGGSPYKLPLAKRARSPGANESAGGLKRKRSFLGGASVAASKAANPTEDESKNNQAASLECLALTGLIGAMISRNRLAVFSEAVSRRGPDAAPGAAAWGCRSRAFLQWFAADGGYVVLHRLLDHRTAAWARAPPDGDEAAATLALELLELLTCHDGSAPGADGPAAPGSIPAFLFGTLVEALVALAPARRWGRACPPHPSPPLAADLMRVIINLCALHVQRPAALRPAQGDAPGTALPEPSLRALLTACCAVLAGACAELEAGTNADVVDLVNCCLCLLINVTERDARVRRLAAATECRGAPLIPFLARVFGAQLEGGTTSGNIVAAYTALLLGCLTVRHGENRDAVREALRARLPPDAGCPMVRLVVVLQEFLLFQSDAHVLTHSTLRGLHAVITELVEANGIVIPVPGAH